METIDSEWSEMTCCAQFFFFFVRRKREIRLDRDYDSRSNRKHYAGSPAAVVKFICRWGIRLIFLITIVIRVIFYKYRRKTSEMRSWVGGIFYQPLTQPYV